MLHGKRIILGVASSVAIYKSLDLIRALKGEGAVVQVVMTPHATQLISPQLFQAISGQKVGVELFDVRADESMPHVGSFQDPDVMVLAPATASLIGRYAMGLATDLLSTLLLSTSAPVVIAPAMNTRMFQHPLVQDHLKKLTSIGVRIVPPREGLLACGIYGAGHFPEVETLKWEIERALTLQDLAGKHVLISTGRTQEPLDPVRVLTNRSSGRMGLALAKAAVMRGAAVTVVSGGVDIAYPAMEMLTVLPVETAMEMRDAVMATFPTADVFISAAAVSDFRPSHPSSSKWKKTGESITLSFEENDDILQEAAAQKRPHQQVIGFALETEGLVERAERKRLTKGLDLVVANGPEMLGAGKGECLFLSDRTHRRVSGTKEQIGEELFRELQF